MNRIIANDKNLGPSSAPLFFWNWLISQEKQANKVSKVLSFTRILQIYLSTLHQCRVLRVFVRKRRVSSQDYFRKTVEKWDFASNLLLFSKGQYLRFFLHGPTSDTYSGNLTLYSSQDFGKVGTLYNNCWFYNNFLTMDLTVDVVVTTFLLNWNVSKNRQREFF